MRYLLIEDNDGYARLIKRTLESRGHEVDWYYGIREIRSDGTADGITREQGPNNPEKTTSFQLAGYDGAFLDSMLPGLAGPTILMQFKKLQLPFKTCAISNAGQGNSMLTQAGAEASCLKGLVASKIDDLIGALS